ncbi:MAG TPA: divergent polysaccharide deacetylase family protein [Desulfobacteraceae bacterium]|nr:divergent polysaccharide deacetylase family protein [Desulfobacteraceae bacterium]
MNSFAKVFAALPGIALIIDDIGPSYARAKQFLDLEVPITYSILPHFANSFNLAIEIHSRGHEIMLHQPMEPYNSSIDPGPGALYVGYDSVRIMNIMQENLSSLPYISGINNHMGSKFTECQEEVKKALNVIRSTDLFFIDSLTSCHSIAYKTARRLNIASACRNIFLDNIPEETAIIRQLARLKKHALRYGGAIGIGHPYPETARAISQFLNGHENTDKMLVYASRLLK